MVDGSAVATRTVGSVVVVGAAQGIGRSVARRLAVEPDVRRLVLADIRTDAVESLSAVPAVPDTTVGAGIFRARPSLEVGWHEFDEVLRVNLMGAFFVAQAFARPMVERRRGSIVAVTSIAARMPRMRQAAYSASKAGVRQALRVLASQGRRGALGRILTSAANDVETGASLSQALYKQRKLLPWVLIQVVTVAELSGSLDMGLRLLGRQFEQEDFLRRRVRSAMTYPVVVLAAALAVVSFMVTFVVPRYAGLFSQLDAQLPASTLFVLGLSDFVRNQWYLLLLYVFMLAGGIWVLFRFESVRFRWSWVLLKLPVLGEILLKRELARLTRTLATLMNAGVPILNALEVVEGATGSLWLASRLRLIIEDVRVGGALANALKRHRLLPGMFQEMVSVGEVIGDVDGMLNRVGDTCESDVNLIVDRLTSILEPVLVVVLGAAVVSVIVPIILPMFEIYEHLAVQ